MYHLLVAWVFYSFTGAFMLLVSLFGSVLRGFDKVRVAQKIIFLASLASNIAIWAALYFGFNLWALGIGGTVNIILSLYLFFHPKNHFGVKYFVPKLKNNTIGLKKLYHYNGDML